MEVYKCDFCEKEIADRKLVVDLPASFYEDVIDDVNSGREDNGETPTTTAELAKDAGRVWLCVGAKGESANGFEYDACPECLIQLLEAEAKRRANKGS